MAINFTNIVDALSEKMSVDDIDNWLDTPHDVFNGETPFQVISQGRQDEVLAYINSDKS